MKSFFFLIMPPQSGTLFDHVSTCLKRRNRHKGSSLRTHVFCG